jgi:hypothetical protein
MGMLKTTYAKFGCKIIIFRGRATTLKMCHSVTLICIAVTVCKWRIYACSDVSGWILFFAWCMLEWAHWQVRGHIGTPWVTLKRLRSAIWPLPKGFIFNPRRAGALFVTQRAGGTVLRPPSSNSAPELRRDKRQAAFERSQQDHWKVLRSFFTKVKNDVTRGQKGQIFENSTFSYKPVHSSKTKTAKKTRKRHSTAL